MAEAHDALDQLIKNLSLEDKAETEKAKGNTEKKAGEKAKQGKQEKKQEKGREKGIAEKQDVTEAIIWNAKKLVFFDLETTGLERDCDIVQISAIFGCRTFDQYVFPTKAISAGASKANGLKVKDEELYYKGKRVESVDPKSATESFVGFLKGAGEQVVMVAHNGHRFDVPRLLRIMDSVRIQLPDNIEGFLDSLLLAKKLYPGRRSYTQPNLVSDLLEVTYEAHNAAADVKALQCLVGVMIRDTEQAVWENCFTPRSAVGKNQ